MSTRFRFREWRRERGGGGWSTWRQTTPFGCIVYEAHQAEIQRELLHEVFVEEIPPPPPLPTELELRTIDDKVRSSEGFRAPILVGGGGCV